MRNASYFVHTILGYTLQHVDDHEYLGVSISHDLCLEKLCNKMAT